MQTWKDLKELELQQLVDYINIAIKKEGSLKKAAEQLCVNESTIRKYLNKHNYKRVQNKFIFDDTCNSKSNTLSTKEKIMTHEITDVIQSEEFKQNMLYLNQEIETIKVMLNWFQDHQDDICNPKDDKDIIEIKQGIKIDLPIADIKRTTIRINSKVWDMFDEFSKLKKIDKHDLMGQALLDFMQKYK